MPYKNIEDQRAYAKKHYAENKRKYNPKRELQRKIAQLTKYETYRAINEIKDASKSRWVSPDELRSIIAQKTGDRYSDAIDVFRSLVKKDKDAGYLDGAEEVGAFLGKATFHPVHEKEDFDTFKAQMPRRKREDLKAELLILKIVIERNKSTWTPTRLLHSAMPVA